MKFHVLVVLCFGRPLGGKRDSNFFTCGQLCKFIRKLCCRLVVSSEIPTESVWSELLDFDLPSAVLVTSETFLRRSRLDIQVTAASKVRAEFDLCNSKASKETIELAAAKHKENFAVSGRAFLVHLLGEVLGHVNLTSELVRGLASFDPQVLFSLPTDLGSSYFALMYRSFCSRGWVKPEGDEYFFKKSHAIAYAITIIVQLNLICEG